MNIIITGFMGTGKSSAGRMVAERLGMGFVDMDEAIVERAGMPITEMFARLGEEAFRDAESEMARELGRLEGLVIATGGGAMLREENRSALGENGLIVCLTCDPTEVLQRLEGDGTRPLLAEDTGGGKRERIEALMASRSAVYASLPVVLDTTGLSLEEVAEAIMREYRKEECRSFT